VDGVRTFLWQENAEIMTISEILRRIILTMQETIIDRAGLVGID
jgi:hypothetical protein